MRSTSHRCAAVVCAALVGLAVSVAPAYADFAPLGIGGNGGSPFRVDCGEFGILVGMTGQSGEVLDSIGGLCVKIDPISGTWIGGVYETARHGGSGGGAFNKKCLVGSALHEITAPVTRFNDSTVVGPIEIRCMELGINSTLGLPVITGAGIAGSVSQQPSSLTHTNRVGDICNGGFFQKGINGRVYSPIGLALEGLSGLYVDRIHLVCGEINQDTRGYRVSFQPSSNITVLEGTPLQIAWRATGTKPELTPNLEYQWVVEDLKQSRDRSILYPAIVLSSCTYYGVQLCSQLAWSTVVHSAAGTSVTFNSLPPSDYSLRLTVRSTVTSTGTTEGSFLFTILPNLIASLTFAPDSIRAGSETMVTVKMEGPVPPAGRVLHLASSNPNLVAVPATITLPGGLDRVTFSIRANPNVSSGGQATIWVSTKVQPIPVVAVGKSRDISIYTRGLPDETQPEASLPPPAVEEQPAEQDVPTSEEITERGVRFSKVSPKSGASGAFSTLSGSSAVQSAVAQDTSSMNTTLAVISAAMLPSETKQAVLTVQPGLGIQQNVKPFIKP